MLLLLLRSLEILKQLFRNPKQMFEIRKRSFLNSQTNLFWCRNNFWATGSIFCRLKMFWAAMWLWCQFFLGGKSIFVHRKLHSQYSTIAQVTYTDDY